MNISSQIPKTSSSPLIILGIAILVVIIVGIYFFTAEKEKAPDIPWQMCHGTAQHTGQSAYTGSQTGTLKWKYQYYEPAAGEKIPNPPKSFAIASDETIYTAAMGTLYAFTSEGKILWSVSGLGRGEGGAVALSPDESTVYAVSGKKLSAYTTEGTRVWETQAATDIIHGEVTVASDGTLYLGSADSYIYAIDPDDGSTLWKFETGGSIGPLASPTLSFDEETIYVGSGDPNNDPDGTIYAIIKDGELLWSKKVDPNRASGVAVASDGSLYANGGTRVHHLAADGTQLWVSAEWSASSLVPSISADGTVYVGTGPDGKVYALDGSTGDTLWSFQSAPNPEFNPNDSKNPEYGIPTNIVIGADGIIYFGSIGKTFYAVNPDGSLLWEYPTGAPLDENCPSISPDGTVYFSAQDGIIYAVN